MKLFEYLNGQGGIMILGFVVILVLLIKKYKNYRYVKDIEKRRKNKDK